MQGSIFTFKHFSISQSLCAMKVGTDGVLIGAWADSDNRDTILDIGSGTGLISLMLGQRFQQSSVTGVEIDPSAYTESLLNIRLSGWGGRIEILNQSIQEFAAGQHRKFGLIVSNPPFYQTSFRPEDVNRSIARHNDQLPFPDLLSAANKLLADNGSFCFILPAESQTEIDQLCVDLGLTIAKKCFVHPTPEKPAKRIMYSITKQTVPFQSELLVVESNGRHQYSAEYRNLTKEFYLAF